MTEIVRQAFKTKGYSTKFFFVPWKRALYEVKVGDRDLVFGAYFSKERAQMNVFSEAFYEIEISLVSPKSHGLVSYSKLEDLSKYNIGVIRGFVNSEGGV